MPATQHHALRILVIQFWTADPRQIESSLREAGVDASLTRVDFEAALNAALAHERFDVAIYDPSTPGLTRETVEACFKLNQREMPLLVLEEVTTIGARVAQIVAPRRN